MVRTSVKEPSAGRRRAVREAPASDVAAYERDLHTWPGSWMGVKQDVPLGEQLLASFRPFIAHLAASGLSPKTIRKHVANLWLLGGEIIRDLNDDPSLRKVSADRLLRMAVHADGGPLIHNGLEDEQYSFDSTCRKLHRFLTQPPH
jgi:hypothetical protein